MTNKRKLGWLGAIGLTVAGAALLACAGLGNSDSGDPVQVGSGQSPAVQASRYTPVVTDFVLKVNVLEKSCFGSAGCNVTYRMDVAYTGAVALDPHITYEITFEVKGTKDQKIGTLTVTGTEFHTDEREIVQITSSGKTLTAEITGIKAR